MPNLILFSKYGSNFTPFTLKGSPIARDEAFAYAPEVRFVLNNKSLLKEVYVEEYKNSPTPFMGETAPSALFAILTWLTGSLEKSFIAADFIFPPIVFVVLFFIAKKFIKNYFFALSAAFVATISRDFIAVIPYPAEIIKYLTVQENQTYLLYFSRAFHPQVSLVFLLAPLLAVFALIKNPKDVKNILVLGIFFGIVFYSYVFYWTLFCFFYAILGTYLLWKKQYTVVKSLLVSSLVALPIAAAYLLNMYHFYQLDTINDFVTKSSLHNMPAPLILIRYLVLGIILLTVAKKKDIDFTILITFLFAGILITPVSKFLIGQDLETLHYLRRALMPIATISLFIIVYNLLANKKALLTYSALLTLVVFSVYGVKTQLTATDLIKPSHLRNLDLENTMAWLNKNAEKSAVIGSLDPNFSSLIPVYTNHKVFMPPTDRTVMPTYEGIERYKILSELLGIDNNAQKEELDNLVSYFFVYQSYDQNRALNKDSPRRQQAENQIEELSQNNAWIDKLSKIKLDYVVVTPVVKDIKPNLSRLEPTTSINEYIVFKLK